MSGESEEDGGLLSLTEMLLKELQHEVLQPQNDCNGQKLSDVSTPPLNMSWQAALLKPSSKTSLEGQSFMELLDGEVQNEVNTNRTSDPNSLPNCRSKSSVPPLPCSLPNTAVPPPTMMKVPPPSMMKVPPPVAINVPPPNLQFSRPPFPSMAVPPPTMCPIMPANCPPVPPPPAPPFMNGGFTPVPSSNSFGSISYYGYGNVSNNASFSELPISVTEIPDTTLATQLKLKRKKKTKKEPKNTSNGIVFTSSPVKSPSTNSMSIPSAMTAIAISVASILPPPVPPKMVAPPLVSSPVEIKTPNLKHVKEHKLVVKVDKRTLKEKAAPVKAPEKKRAIVAEYDSESDDERYDVESYRKRALHRSITSVRLDENEALPDLYSKLKKLNEELALLQHNEASKSSESDSSDSSCKGNSPKFKKRKLRDAKDAENHSNGKENDSSTGRTSPLVMSEENLSAPRPKLDVRIKMMMDDKMASPVKVPSTTSKRQSLPPPVTLTEELHDPKGRTVAFDSLPPPSAVASDVPASSRLFLPLDRAPSPFLSEEIYQYWQKESIKFRKFLKKSPKFVHLDPNGRYKFRKNRFASVTKNTLKSAEALGIYSILDKKLKKNSECQEKKASAEHEKAIVSAEIDEDLKRLEAITRELQMLEEEEKRMQMEEAMIGNDDDGDGGPGNARNLSEENNTVDPLMEVSDDLKRLEEIQRQLRELEEEEAMIAHPENEMDCDRINYVNTAVNKDERVNMINSKTTDVDDGFDVARLQDTSSAEHSKSDDKPSNNNNYKDQSSTKASDPGHFSRAKSSFQNELRGVKRPSEDNLISLVMDSVMEELRKDLKSSIAKNLLKNHHEVDEFSKKKRKSVV